MASVKVPLNEIRRLYYKEELSVRQIASRLQITTQSIYYHASNGRLRLERRKKTLEKDVLTKLRVDERLSAPAIAKFLRTSSKIVYREMNRFGFAGPPRGRPRKPLDPDELRRLYVDEALPVREVAARMNVCASKVRMELDHAGIEVRRYSAPAIFPADRYIKIGDHLQTSGLPESARQYAIRLETKLVRGLPTLVVGMAEISRLYHVEMLTMAEIARLLGISSAAIGHHRSKGHLFLEKRQERRKKTLDVDALRHLYLEKRLTMREVAERLDTCSSIVAREIDRHGIREQAHRRERTRIDADEVLRLYSVEGLPIREVAEGLKVCPRTVRNEMRRLGIVGRARRGPMKYPMLANLKVGEIVYVEVSPGTRRPRQRIYKTGSSLGVKFKTKRVDETTCRVTRVA